MEEDRCVIRPLGLWPFSLAKLADWAVGKSLRCGQSEKRILLHRANVLSVGFLSMDVVLFIFILCSFGFYIFEYYFPFSLRRTYLPPVL